MIKTVKITKIEKEYYEGEVYNLHLKSKSEMDDLYWVDFETGLVNHNCFPVTIFGGELPNLFSTPPQEHSYSPQIF